MKNSIYILSVLFFLSGCAGITPEPEKEGKIYERDGVSTLLIPSDKREVYFKDRRSFERHCRAPGPDVSIQSSSGISLGASIIGKNEELSDTSGQSGLSLGGRDPAVLLTRELMYRACELVSNLNADQKTTISIYNRFLKTVEKSIKMQQLVGTASATDSAKSSLQNISLADQKEPNTTVTTNTNTTTKSTENETTNTIGNTSSQSTESNYNTPDNTNDDATYNTTSSTNSDTISNNNDTTNTSGDVPF